MSDHHETIAQQESYSEHPTFMTYMVVFGALIICTAASFVANFFFPIPSKTGLTIIMLVSIVKATLVAMYFMHLKFDWGKLYFLIIPVLVLTVMMVIVLLPDTVFAWH